jgi:hypothetical protein
MSMSERVVYNDTMDSPYRYAFPRLRAYLAAPLQSPALTHPQRIRGVGQVAVAAVKSRWRKLHRRLRPSGSTRKVIYQ